MAPLMSLEQVRIVDPLLTTVVQGYTQPDFVGSFLFPPVPVDSRTGHIIEFGKEDFALYNTRRAPGGPTKRRSMTYGSRKYSLYQDSIEGELPREFLEESNVSTVNFDFQRMAAESAMRTISLSLEYEQAKLATDATKYDTNHKQTLSGTDQFDDPASDPIATVNSWREAIRATIGVYPNSAIIGPGAFNGLENNPRIRDQTKYVSAESVTQDSLARMFKLDRGVRIGSSLVLDETTGGFTDIWGNVMILAYVPPGTNNRFVPAYGYTYTLKGYPLAERPYYDDNHKTWYFPATAERSPELTSMAAGFLGQAVVSGS
jgi:hypothetical protein